VDDDFEVPELGETARERQAARQGRDIPSPSEPIGVPLTIDHAAMMRGDYEVPE
jgi:hypothetical protein